MGTAGRLDPDRPLWDQDTFYGRLKHFFWVTDPRTVATNSAELDKAKELIQLYRIKEEPKGTTTDQIVYAKKLYESAFHPDSGDRMNVIGRMSCQVPGGMIITGCMLQFYRTVPQVIFWQWVNQSFNALVNYTNRNAKSAITPTKIGVAYVSATTSAVITALGLKALLEKRTSPLMQRFVPFAAVAAANCVNIPLMRQTNELSVDDSADAKLNKRQFLGTSNFATHHGEVGKIPVDAKDNCVACTHPDPSCWRNIGYHDTYSMCSVSSEMFPVSEDT